MCLIDYLSYPYVNSLISLIVGAIGGGLTNLYLQNRQQRHNHFCQQLDHLYGPVYAQIITYDFNLNIVTSIQQNIWKDKNHDFCVGTFYKNEKWDDYEIMAEGAVDKSFSCLEKIFSILTSNIAYAEKKDIKSIEDFIGKYLNHINSYGSSESPQVFSNYCESTKLPDNFRRSILDGYEGLLRKIK